MNVAEGFLRDAIKRFKEYKQLGDRTFEQLTDENNFFWQPTPESNSIAVIVQHLYGNMRSRWTNFLTEDGEKEWRKRDAEFEEIRTSKEDILSFWNEGWNCLFSTLETLTPADLEKSITIRTQPIPVYDAILRQLAHYSGHVGQIMYIGRMLKGSEWQSLSIPKGGSNAYLEKMKPQHGA